MVYRSGTNSAIDGRAEKEKKVLDVDMYDAKDTGHYSS
jgi:hypothetical protein